MADTVKIKFSEARVTKEAKPQLFEAGKEYNLSPASAKRWVRRGVAEIVPVRSGNDGGKGDNRANK